MEGANQRFALVRDDQPGAAFDQGSYTASVGNDHWSSAGDRFRRGIPKILILRWQNKNIRIGKRRPFVLIVEGTGKKHGRTHTQPPYSRF